MKHDFSPDLAAQSYRQAVANPSARQPLRSPFWRWVMLTFMATPFGVAASISWFHISIPLPPCLFQAIFGFPAPSCGLTRSVLAIARGDWQTALSYHLFGPLILLAMMTLAIVAITELVSQRALSGFYQRLLHPPSLWVLLSLFMAYYGLRLWARWTLPGLPLGVDETAFWQAFLSGAVAL